MELRFDIWHLPKELRLLLDIALRQPIAAVDGDLDQGYVERLVQQHRFQPLLIRSMKAMDPELLKSCPVLAELRTQQNRYTMGSFVRLKALAEVNALFAEHGIRMLSMKGPLLSMELYGDPSLRTSRDLDLLLRWEDMHRAGELLRSIGYAEEGVPIEENPFLKTPKRRSYYELIEREKHAVYNRGEVCLELHWRSSFQTEGSFEDFWANREVRTVLGQKISIHGHAQRYPALVEHGAEHGFARLRWLLDLYELQKKPQFSWAEVYGRMQEMGVGELLLETILVMYRLGLPNLPDLQEEAFSVTQSDGVVTLTVRENLRQDAQRAAQLCEQVYPLLQQEVHHEDEVWRAYDRLLPTGNFEKTFLQKLMIATGPNLCDFELIDLPDNLFWLYYLIRPAYWLWRKLTGGNQ